MRVGLDIGSTTIKIVVLDDNNKLIASKYQRHFSQITQVLEQLIEDLEHELPHLKEAYVALSGSASLGIAEDYNLQFVQEVYAEKIAAEMLEPRTDVIIELGGEDAKMLFLGRHFDARMNDCCAGGTGAFIDQMASLLNVKTEDMDKLAAKTTTRYTIASRCGVFAKSDIQPLLNQGAAKEDLAASIFHAVASQAVTGLAKGRPIKGNVLYLGGPLSFMSQLRASFDEILHIQGTCPEHSLYYVAIGSALCADKIINLTSLKENLTTCQHKHGFNHLEPLFTNAEEFAKFQARHEQNNITLASMNNVKEAFIGIDSGSTTIKIAVMNKEGELVDSFYESNHGNPVIAVRKYLLDFYKNYPECKLIASAVTGYGEDLIKHGFGVDYGIVETMAHFFAAKYLQPQVDFIIDIGGQDMKCLKIHNGAIDNIFLNEACSSGCGSFLQTFAELLGYDVKEFAKLGETADKPVDLGSRCTVFMNSSVKQAQKDGASVANISAGLAMSIVKNALYKVIRTNNPDSLGQHMVVQGGTFLNDCVLRAFEKEMGKEVIRPNIAGLMGAYGAALYAQKRYEEKPKPTSLLNAEQLTSFNHTVKNIVCQGCQNHCHLTINTFSSDKPFISGNRCERPVTHAAPKDDLNLYRYKLKLLKALPNLEQPLRGVMGIPMGLNMYELLPFWQALLNHLGFKVITSPIEDKSIYQRGQGTIPSDTICYPAKLMHGHIAYLLEQKIEHIFYPCMTYNIDEHNTENCYNCPVVAYYPEVLDTNIPELDNVHFYHDYVGLLHKNKLAENLLKMFKKDFPNLTKRELNAAIQAAFKAYDNFQQHVKMQGQVIIEGARKEKMPIIVLAGRPYHIDPKVNHSIDRLITTLGAALISEDAISSHISSTELNTDLHVLNQWTYHSRLYAAAKYVAQNEDMHMVQLVNFGCGCDAITADECRRILEENGKIYTQIKIDDIDNLGAAKIRLRSLFSAAHLIDD
ncbi:MAG: acyl-CoA dehydratase activase [Phascolarctobacterium sp.]|nr:acyl-CoA dehydratase activase [Phascolarctobacterium sp.]